MTENKFIVIIVASLTLCFSIIFYMNTAFTAASQERHLQLVKACKKLNPKFNEFLTFKTGFYTGYLLLTVGATETTVTLKTDISQTITVPCAEVRRPK